MFYEAGSCTRRRCRWLLPATAFLLCAGITLAQNVPGEGEARPTELEWTGGKVLPGRTEVIEWGTKLAELIDQSDFWMLEGELAEAEATERWTLEGLPAAMVFHQVIDAQLEFDRKEFEERNVGILEAWKQEYPSSPAPRALLARLYLARALRGEEVADEGLDASSTTEHVGKYFEQAAEVLMKAGQEVVVMDFELVRIALEMTLRTPASDKERRTILMSVAELQPENITLYWSYLHSLFPRWNGSGEAYAGFCQKMYERLEGSEGEILYARMAGYALESGDPAKLLSEAPFDAGRIHRGYRQAFARFPVSRAIAREYYGVSRATKNKAGQDWIFEQVSREAGVDVGAEGRRELWVRLGRDVDAVLFEAARSGDGPLVVVMLRLGADPFRKHAQGMSAREAAEARGYAGMEALLLEAEAGLQVIEDRRGEDSVGTVKARQGKQMRELVARGTHTAGSMSEEALTLQAVQLDDPRNLLTLLEAGVDPNTESDDWSLLRRAAYYGSVDHIRMLLDYGADIELKSSKGLTALHVAAEQNQTGAIEVLLDRGAKLNARYPWGDALWTPLGLAVYYGRLEAAKLLIQRGADPHQPMGDVTYLAAAVRGKNPVMVRFLVELGVDPNVGEISSGVTPLQLAAQFGEEAILKYFIRGVKLDVNHQNAEGSTALHIAAAHGQIRSLEILLASGGDTTIRNRFNATPYATAKFWRKTKAMELLAPHPGSTP